MPGERMKLTEHSPKMLSPSRSEKYSPIVLARAIMTDRKYIAFQILESAWEEGYS